MRYEIRERWGGENVGTYEENEAFSRCVCMRLNRIHAMDDGGLEVDIEDAEHVQSVEDETKANERSFCPSSVQSHRRQRASYGFLLLLRLLSVLLSSVSSFSFLLFSFSCSQFLFVCFALSFFAFHVYHIPEMPLVIAKFPSQNTGVS